MHKKDKVIEIGELRTILRSQVLRRILQERKKYYQGKVNEYVRAQKFTEAYGALKALDDIDKFGDIMQTEYEKLIKEKGEQDNG